MTKNFNLVLEKGDDNEIGGSVDAPGFFYTTVGTTEADVIANMRSLIADFLAHEGKDMTEWQGVSADEIQFNIEYDLTALFEIFNAIKIGSIAELAGINKGLMRQYASGVKSASAQQAKKVETAIRQLGERLTRVKVA